jgi:hypothetical protein
MKRALLVSILLSVALAAASAFAVDRALAADVNLRLVVPGASPYVFVEEPRWVAVPGTRIYTIDGNARPDYDIFRHGSYFYVYRAGKWYRARTWNGRYVAVAERSVPVQFNSLPRERWRAYPPGWEKRAMKANSNAKGKKAGKDRY